MCDNKITQHSHDTGKQISVVNFNDIFDKIRFISALFLITLFTPNYISFVFRNGFPFHQFIMIVHMCNLIIF